MQIEDVASNPERPDSLAERPHPGVAASPMLGVCVAPGCTTVVFGHGTCVEHDPPRPHLAETLLDEAAAGTTPDDR